MPVGFGLFGANTLRRPAMTVTIHPPTFPLTEAEMAPWRVIPVAVAVDLCPEAQVDPDLGPLLPPDRQPPLFGPAVTAQCVPPNYGAVPNALDEVPACGVLVIAAGGHRDHAMIGGILGGYLQRRGAAGLVCDGAIRDVAELAALPSFAVFTRHTTPRGPVGRDQGAVHAPVTVGGAKIQTGDLILGDADGLVALPPEAVRDLAADAAAHLKKEEGWVADLEAGKSLAETFAHPPANRL